ncbi:NAD(P)-binding protein [Xylariaceae sp. FL1651]|nr:NAD(P)-binding protein [Xylariaceae sp. FL1651]
MAVQPLPLIPLTHRALLLKSSTYPYDMSVVEKETLKVGLGSAVIRVPGSGVLKYGGRVYSRKKPYPYPEPFVPGSASVSQVVAVGLDATTLQPGQFIFFDSFITGRDNTNSLILHVPLENCCPLDEDRLMGNPVTGGLGYKIENLMYLFALMVPCGGLMDVGVKTGNSVIIAPATGTFGSAAILVALALGSQVIAMSRNREALELLKAAHPGARLNIVQNTGNVEADAQEFTKDGQADVFFDISPGKAILSTQRISLMGDHHELSLPTQVIMLQDITIKGKWMYKLDDIRLGDIKTIGTFTLEQFEAAFEAAAAINELWAHVYITL